MSGEGLVLQAARGDSPVGSCEADGGPVSIGRWNGSTLRLEDESILPVHVVLDPEGDDRWRLIAIAPEGCVVNGRNVRRAWVRRGDKITVGPYSITVGQATTSQDTSVVREVPSAHYVAHQGPELPLKAVLRWRGTVLDTRMLAPNEVLTLGRGRQVTFELPSGERRSWGAAACLDGVWHVALDTPLRVIDATGNDRPLLSTSPRTTGPELPKGIISGKVWAPISEGARLRLDSGELTVDLERSTTFGVERIVRPPRWATKEGQDAIIALLVFIWAIAMFWVTPRDWFQSDDESVQMRNLVAQFKAPPPSAAVDDAIKHLTHQQDKLAEEGQAKHSGEEGKSGKQNAPDRDTHSSRTNDQVVADNSLLRMLNSGAANKVLGGGALGQLDAIGHLDGAAAGDAQGNLGLGLHGNGPGGGGDSNDTAGVALSGHGPSLSSASKVGGLKKGGNATDLAIDEPANVAGGLDREVIRRVILSHRAQIRYCYEKELSSHPDLAGKVLVQFIIAADGTVTMARPTEQTIADPEVGKCITSKVKMFTFPKPKGGGVVDVTYPFLFKPAGQGAH